MIQIWDFATSFLDYLEIKPFQIEDLLAGLKYSAPQEVGLVTDLFAALCDCLIWDIPESENDTETWLWMLKTYTEGKIQLFWPEILIILIQSEMFDFEVTPEITALVPRLRTATPETFANCFSHEEKHRLLVFLVNTCHDLQGFRDVMNERMEQKTDLSKQKNELYNQIKEEEQAKLDVIRDNADKDFIIDDTAVQQKIATLEAELAVASRTEGRKIQDELNALKKERNAFNKKIDGIQNRITGLQSKIDRLNE